MTNNSNSQKWKKESKPMTDDVYPLGEELQNQAGQNLAVPAIEDH